MLRLIMHMSQQVGSNRLGGVRACHHQQVVFYKFVLVQKVELGSTSSNKLEGVHGKLMLVMLVSTFIRFVASNLMYIQSWNACS